MADLVFAAGASHGPSIQKAPETWAKLAEKDPRDPRFDYQALLKRAKPGMDQEITIDMQRARHAASQRGLAELQARLKAARLDVVVVVSNAHVVNRAMPRPVFALLRAADLRSAEATGATFETAATELGEVQAAPGHPELATYLIETLNAAGFDVGCVDNLPEGALLDEAFAFCYKYMFGGVAIPMAPFYLSRDLPNQPSGKRCLELGAALREQILKWPAQLRLGLIASGGLSHQVVDEELDRGVIAALTSGNLSKLADLPRDRLNASPGTPEILNWVTVGAAMAPAPMTLLSYEPCYRSLAGTGHGVALGVWESA